MRYTISTLLCFFGGALAVLSWLLFQNWWGVTLGLVLLLAGIMVNPPTPRPWLTS